MLNLITGMLGSGKTCYSLKFMQDEIKDGRPLYVHGVRDLQLLHTPVVCKHPLCKACRSLDDTEFDYLLADQWHIWAPIGAVFFYDECQFVFPARSSTSRTLDSVTSLTTSRHDGTDFFFLTQNPALIDFGIRALISRHIHLLVNWSGRHQYEWSECKSNTQYTSDAVHSSYKLDKKIFPLYKSAELHTKQKRKMPIQLYILIFLVPVILLLGRYFYNSRFGDKSKQSDSTIAQSGSLAAKNSFKSIAALDYTPISKGYLESAPAYSDIVKVKTYPRISACVQFNDDCRCYTQQATIYPTRVDYCLSIVHGAVFNPYVADRDTVSSAKIPAHL